MVVWLQNGSKCSSGLPSWLRGDCELQLPATAQHHETGSYHLLVAWGKDQNSKPEIRFLLNVYPFHTIVKSKEKSQFEPS